MEKKSRFKSPIGIQAHTKKELEWYLKNNPFKKSLVIREVKQPTWHKNMGLKWKKLFLL